MFDDNLNSETLKYPYTNDTSTIGTLHHIVFVHRDSDPLISQTGSHIYNGNKCLL